MKLTSHRTDQTEVSLLTTGTLVIWACCLVVGAIGLRVGYPWPKAPEKQAPPVQAQLLRVELTNDPSPDPEIGPPSAPQEMAPDQPPPAPATISMQAAPALVAVAEPNPAIAFALPVEGPSRIVDARQAIPTRAPATQAESRPLARAAVAGPVVPKHLTLGQGEGRQPAPEYPREAALAHQQGTVLVRFTVGENGRVQTAQAISPCPFPLLNQAATRAIRENWRFAPGAPRAYEVSIEFELTQR